VEEKKIMLVFHRLERETTASWIRNTFDIVENLFLNE